LISKG